MAGGFWQRVLESEMAVPSDRPLPDLTVELVTMLGSVSPIERDEIAFPVLATWLHHGVYDDLLVSFGDSICTGLRVGLGEGGTDTVFRRSFSALTLAACLERDNAAHLLPIDTVMSWAEKAIGWFTREEDLRGYVPGKGWAHTVAHGADLVGALAQSRHLDASQLGVLLDVIAERVTSSTSTVLVDGEDDRLALATLAALQRNLVETPTLDSWVESMAECLGRIGGAGEQPGPTAAARNCSRFLRALYVHLSIGVSPHGLSGFKEAPQCRADLLLSLLSVIPRHTPWLYADGDR
ncbi:MAG: DUF2785 domain-containing protein [Nocardioidaceae bacterium]